MQLRRRTLTAHVFGNAVQRMDVHVQNVAVFVNQADGLLLFAVVFDDLQPVEPAHTVVDVGNVIARVQVVKFFDGQAFLAAEAFAQAEFVVTLKKLVVGVAEDFQVVVHKPGVQAYFHRRKLYRRFCVAFGSLENGLQPFNLFGVVRQDQGAVAFGGLPAQVFFQQVEFFVESRLGRLLKKDFFLVVKGRTGTEFHGGQPGNFFHKMPPVDKKFIR